MCMYADVHIKPMQVYMTKCTNIVKSVHICMYVYMYIHTCIDQSICLHIYICIYVYTYIYICIYIYYTYTCMCIYIYVHMCICIHIYICMKDLDEGCYFSGYGLCFAILWRPKLHDEGMTSVSLRGMPHGSFALSFRFILW